MHYIGLDIHKKDTQASVLDEKGKFIHGERIRTDVVDIGHFFERMERMNDDDRKVVIEATGFYFWIYDVIVERGHQVKVVHPNRAKALMKARSKPDRNDALMLAQLLRLGGLEGIYVPSEDVRELRDLTRHRESLVRKKGDLKREMIGALDQHGLKVPAGFKTNFSNKFNAHVRGLGVFLINEKLDLLDTTIEKLKNVEAMLEERYGKDDDVELMTMPDIGIVTASVLKGEIGDIGRFQSFGNLATYTGLTPSRSQSGEKEWFWPTRHGNDRIKHVLIEATLSYVHHKNDTKIKDFYERKKG
ncbi:MAG TPA: IS110 family transposase, partial [Methanomassiliicoccales archaeon]|nr:IS110 family transposase [Methanomassiliicoccales archaeon]